MAPVLSYRALQNAANGATLNPYYSITGYAARSVAHSSKMNLSLGMGYGHTSLVSVRPSFPLTPLCSGYNCGIISGHM